MRREKIFNREYFDGESGKPGYYQKRYEFNRLYPHFEFIAMQIKKILQSKNRIGYWMCQRFSRLSI